MPRKSRDYYLSDFYHIMIQGDEKKFIFNQKSYKDKYIYLLKRNAFRNDVKIVAYCVMDNHVHILVHSRDIKLISKMMSQCNTSYGIYFSQKRGNVGHVFRDRYKSEPIYSKIYLLNCIKYIHENPVKANIVKVCEQYHYSSYQEYLNKNGIFDNELKEICGINDEDYISLIKDTHTDVNYIDEMENFIKVFEEIKIKYELEKMTDERIVNLYKELEKRCKVTKTQVAKSLNIDRKKFSRILCRYGYIKNNKNRR